MGKGRKMIQRLAEEASLATGALPGYPIVELAGDSRVLVENHLGIMEYGKSRITVKMAYGAIQIQGECLDIRRMTCHQLVICGNIQGIILQRRECACGYGTPFPV